jgi:hypothetical protein
LGAFGPVTHGSDLMETSHLRVIHIGWRYVGDYA